MDTLVLRLSAGEDLRAVLSQVLSMRRLRAACVVSAVGSFARVVDPRTADSELVVRRVA